VSLNTSLNNKLESSFSYGKHTIKLTTDYLAKQANASVLIRMGDTCVQVAITTAPSEGSDFLPLMVTVLRRHYANGQIAGGYIKRETNRGSEEEVLTCRLIDRAIRPLFPEGFNDEIQITCSILSIDPEVSPDVPCFLGVSAALAISDLPFTDIVAAIKIGYINNEFTTNPSDDELEASELNLFLAAKDAQNQDGILMIEAAANEISEDIALDAIPFGLKTLQTAIDGIKTFQSAYKDKHPEFVKRNKPEALNLSEIEETISSTVEKYCKEVFAIDHKQGRVKAFSEHRAALKEKHEEKFDPAHLSTAIDKLEKKWARDFMFTEKKRLDLRTLKEIRHISIEESVFPRVHGDCIFQRGETQSYVTATLAAVGKGEMFESISGKESRRDFMLYYNFPPYSTGECGRMGPPKRRELGHGALARRSFTSVLPSSEEFPYTIRVVSETMESNGSSSMATVCGATLAMLSAGVPLKRPVAGIAMGLVKGDNDTFILSDITADEDRIGDMDFKVVGSEKGMTALQMDIKIDGVTTELLKDALNQAKEGRLHILSEMNKVLSVANPVSKYAPRMFSFNIKTEKIKDVIGKGGSVIREIIEKFGVEIDISDDGKITISAVDSTAGETCKQYILDLVEELEIDQIYEGVITKIMDFGAVVDLGNNKDGFLHISQISMQRVNDINDYLQMGQIVKVRVNEIDRNNKVRLSMKEFESERGSSH